MGEQSVLRGLGVQAIDGGNSSHRFLPNIGKVQAVCSALPFTYDYVQHLKRTRQSQRHVQEATRASCQFLTDIEICPGDTVVYRYVHNWGDDDVVDDMREHLVIDHDSLICVIREDGDVYPLAGNVLIENTRDQENENISRVLAVGKPVQRYFDFSDYSDEGMDLLPGDIIGLNIKQSVPVQDVDLGIAIDSILGFDNIAFIKRRHIHFKISV